MTTCTKDDIKYDTSIIDLELPQTPGSTVTSNKISDVRNVIDEYSIIGQYVYKVGRTTGKTKGIVRSINWPMPYGDGALKELIQIGFDTASDDGEDSRRNCKGHANFGEQGDSGSLVVDEQRRAIGLLFGVPNPDATEPEQTYACHILPVLEVLGVCIPTDGTGSSQRCSCEATDGTGLTVKAKSSVGSGELASANTGEMTELRTKNMRQGFIQQEPLTEKDQQHLKALLEELRSTVKGRRLHAAFGHIRREIGYLVRNCRPVTVTWHRNKGPAFFGSLLNHLRGDRDTIPHQIGDMRLAVLLDKMEIVLLEHGSIPLQEEIHTHRDDIRRMMLDGNNVKDFLDYLQKTEKA